MSQQFKPTFPNNQPFQQNIGQTVKNAGIMFNSLGSPVKLGIFIVSIILIVWLTLFIYRRLRREFNQNLRDSPWIIYGTKNARTRMTVDAYKIPKSVDRQYGIEFTYSFWMYIDDWSTKQNEWKHIFHKGNESAIPLQSIGCWLYPKVNKLAININTYASVKESCNIGNIPIKKWVNVIIVCMDRYIDVYINGNLKKRCKLKGVPKLNIGDLYVNLWGGFPGFLSRMRYYNYAIPYWKIEKIMHAGPSQDNCMDTGDSAPPYLAPSWYMTTGHPNAPDFPEDNLADSNLDDPACPGS